MRSLLFLAAAGLAGLSACTSPASQEVAELAPVSDPPDLAPHADAFVLEASAPVELQDAETRDRVARMEGYFPDAVLVDQHGAELHFYRDLVRGKRVVIQFFYSRCSAACPLTTANLAQLVGELEGELGRDFFVYSITLDPEHDTPAVLADHAERLGVRDGWRFLTGAPADIRELRHHLGAFDPDPERDADLEQHAGLLILGNEPLGRWCAVPGQLPPATLARTARRVFEPEPPGQPAASARRTPLMERIP